MDTKYSFRLIVPAVLFGMVLSVPAFAQNSAPAGSSYNSAPNSPNASAPAGQDMNAAGREMKDAGSDTAAAAEDAYHGTTRAVKDTTITAEVKTALKRDPQMRSARIHVMTTAGVVTLKGKVASPDASTHATQVAEQNKGVKSVDNQLMVANSAQSQ